MAEVVRLMCDKCESMEDVASYRLSTPTTGLNRAIALDLCRECARPLAEFEGLGRTVSTSRRTAPKYSPSRGGRPMRAKIYTQEELDELEEEHED